MNSGGAGASAVLLGVLAAMSIGAQPYTRGVGIYPGDPKEDFSPRLRPAAATYRNLALRRAAFHSSSYDYNLTAQLVTDGIRDTQLPRWMVVSSSEQGVLKKNEREWLVDHIPYTLVAVKSPRGWVQVEFGGGESAPEVDRIEVDARVQSGSEPGESWKMAVAASDDGEHWSELAEAGGSGQPAREVKPSMPLGAVSRARFYRVSFEAEGAAGWQISEVRFWRGTRRLEPGGPHAFTSAWMNDWSASGGGDREEWVYVDLGAACEFDRVVLDWIRRAASGTLEVSDDAANWRTLEPLPAPAGAAAGLSDEIRLEAAARGRYVRLRMKAAGGAPGIVLSEMEVWGRGGLAAQPKPTPKADPRGELRLAAGGWRVERDSRVTAGGETLSKPGFDDSGWMAATVPGTVLSSFYNAGAIPDPNFGDNQLMISDSYFHADFWYRDEFVGQILGAGERAWLNFKGINWKAEVYCNGRKLGRIEGAFVRARFDVTGLVRQGEKNALAVRIEKNAAPGGVKEKTLQSPDKNGGALGADNPTFHASIGWDWIPTIRGRNTGIWNSVSLSKSGPVTVEDPRVATVLPLPDTSRADVSIQATLRNHEFKAVAGRLAGSFGDVRFEMPVRLEAGESKVVKLDPATHPALRLEHPKLWWPAGYGEPHLYPVRLEFFLDGRSGGLGGSGASGGPGGSDRVEFLAGVRQFTYSEEGSPLRIWINGRRFIARGGNWGFGESMLRYRAREYDVAVRYHRDMNFTMIRNWVGQIGDDEFYEACDRHGIVVWQDFWLANPADGPDPEDPAMFLRNARDYIRRIRNHASLGLYCGRNEGFPPAAIEEGLRAAIGDLDPGVRYIPSSADKVVSGHGPYRAMPPRFYFEQRATRMLHSELGMPNIVTMDSLRAMMREADFWPQGGVWGLHDFCLGGAQGGAAFRARIEKSYGGADDAATWIALAQFVNYEGHRAMFEAQSQNRMGLLIWMSHPAWPSFVWQTYDYYFEPTAGYFGMKKASEPLHIQWNSAADTVEVVNYSGGEAKGLTAAVQVVNLNGEVKWAKSATLASAEDSNTTCFKMEYPEGLTPVHFIRLELTREGRAVSQNFYWRGAEEGDFRALRELGKVGLEVSTRAIQQGGQWRLTTELRNPSAQPALMVRLKPVRARTGDRILPALFSDNYVSLMPGERRVIQIELERADARGEAPRVVVEGFNVSQ